MRENVRADGNGRSRFLAHGHRLRRVCHTEDILRRGLHSAAARADTIGITGDVSFRERWSFAEEADGNLSLHVGTCVFTSNTPAAPGEPAKNLMVRVVRDGKQKVRVALPARSAPWLLDLIPDEVVETIRAEEIPLEAIMLDLSNQKELYPRQIFSLSDPSRQVDIWLE